MQTQIVNLNRDSYYSLFVTINTLDVIMFLDIMCTLYKNTAINIRTRIKKLQRNLLYFVSYTIRYMYDINKRHNESIMKYLKNKNNEIHGICTKC